MISSFEKDKLKVQVYATRAEMGEVSAGVVAATAMSAPHPDPTPR